MGRRGFLGLMIGGVAASAAVRTWPFRVFSFPTRINVFHGDFPELLAPGLRDVFMKYFDLVIREKSIYEYNLFNSDHPLVVSGD